MGNEVFCVEIDENRLKMAFFDLKSPENRHFSAKSLKNLRFFSSTII